MAKHVGQKLMKEMEFSAGETALVEEANTNVTHTMNQSRVLSELYMVKKLGVLTADLIKANETLATANGRYARSLNWLTGALVFVGLVQVVVQVIGLFTKA